MGNCLFIQVETLHNPKSHKEEKRGVSFLKNNVIAPTQKVHDDEGDEKEDMEGDNSSAPPPTAEIIINQRRFSTISNLTMDDAMLILEQMYTQGGPSRRVSLLIDSSYNQDLLKEDEEIHLMQEMILSYLQVMDEDSHKFNALLLQLRQLECQAKETRSQPASPVLAHRRQRRRSSVLCDIKEEFRQAISTRASISIETEVH